jgi:outer membrane protein OmpA-like peptidoglycan-associated protein
MITVLFAALLAVSQATTDITAEAKIARYEKGDTYMVTLEKPVVAPKTPYIKPVVKKIKKFTIKPEDLTPPVKKEQTETVHFDLNSAALKTQEKKKLDALATKEKVFVTGYTCDTGQKEYNDKLALRRAKTVQKYLKTDAKTEGKGKCCYVSDQKSANRRAEVKYR